ncbi:MAG TPA: hypothetical protein PKN92_13380 [Candidatus Hydrogenedentes bacterium]|jgi:hypothetical protein|nr:hypothetical protein [Candidatus Hydrogenedentota bacterium]
MIQLVLIMVLAPFGAPEIVVDQDGLVTLIESPEERANEEAFSGAVRAYNDYRNNGKGDLEELIAQHERILESDRELVPKGRQMIGNQLADLRRERDGASIAISPERYYEIKEHMNPFFSDNFKDKEEEIAWLQYKEIDLEYEEQRIENLPEEDAIEKARRFYELALTAANTRDAKSRQQCARYQGRSRQKALEAAQKEDMWQREALALVETAGDFLLSELKSLKNAALCREFIAAYPDDKELVERIEKLLGELESN